MSLVTFTSVVSVQLRIGLAKEIDLRVDDDFQSLPELSCAGSPEGIWWYNYDGYGNLTAKTGVNAPAFTAGYDLNNHQIGFSYDANGNQTLDLQGVSARYDVENRIAWVVKNGTAVGNGSGYDPDNRRVYFSKWGYNQSAGEWQLTAGGGYEEVVYYGVTGQKMGNYRLSADLNGLYLTATGYNVWFGSRLVRKVGSDGTASIVRADRLGSFGKYFAYGEQRGTGTADNTEKFATYYRDGDTGLDYAVNRYYSSGWGRFVSPDPYRPSGGPVDPRSWNRYAYAEGDPLNLYDPSGLFATKPGGALDPNPNPTPSTGGGHVGNDGTSADDANVGDQEPDRGNSGAVVIAGPVAVAASDLGRISKSISCGGFVDALAKEAAATPGLTRGVDGLSLSSDRVRQMAAHILASGFVYNGITDNTPMSKVLANSSASGTVSDEFRNPNVYGLSQVDGLAIWLRPEILGTLEAPTTAGLATVLHEVMHKFFTDGDKYNDALSSAARRMWGQEWDVGMMDHCFN